MHGTECNLKDHFIRHLVVYFLRYPFLQLDERRTSSSTSHSGRKRDQIAMQHYKVLKSRDKHF